MAAELSGTARLMAERQRAHATFEERARHFTTSEQTRYDARTRDMATIGDVLLARTCRYDLYASLIASRDTNERRNMVRRIQAFVNDKFRRALSNEEDREFADDMARLFALALQRSRLANLFQMYVIHVAVLLEPTISRAFCPPEPDPDDHEAVDTARVDRLAFTLFEQRYLLPAFVDLSDGVTHSAISFTEHLNDVYFQVLVANPIDGVVRTRNRRRIVFDDEAANAEVAAALGRPT